MTQETTRKFDNKERIIDNGILWGRWNEATDMEKEICIAEVIAPNAGDQRFRSCAPLSDRKNKNPSSALLALLQA